MSKIRGKKRKEVKCPKSRSFSTANEAVNLLMVVSGCPDLPLASNKAHLSVVCEIDLLFFSFVATLRAEEAVTDELILIGGGGKK